MAVKIAIIGAGGMLQYHVAGFKRAGAELTGIADVDLESAQRVAKPHDIPRAFGDVSKLLAGCDADAVSIIVPNKFHHPLAIQCLDAGKHVFCEKPPALNAAEVEDMIAVAESRGKRLMFNFNNRARPEAYAVMELIAEGKIGKINSAQAKWARRTGIPGFGGWFTNRALSGGGPLIDLLHMIDLAMYFMGYPDPAHVLGQTFDNFIGDRSFKGPWGIADQEDGITDVETAAHAFVTFQTGQVLSLWVSWAEMVEREEVSVVFQGTAAGGKMQRLFAEDGIDRTANDTLDLYYQAQGESVTQRIEVEACEDMGRSRSAENFALSIEGRESPLNTPAQALTLMRIIDAVYQSAADRMPVSLLRH